MYTMHSYKGLAAYRPLILLPPCIHAGVHGVGPRICSREGLRDKPANSLSRRIGKHVVHVGFEEASALLDALKGGSGALGVYLEGAPPLSYLLYLLGAGFGLPFSEDALMIWVASRMMAGHYGSWEQSIVVLVIMYTGVVVSDMITFYIGVAMRMGLFRGLKDRTFRDNAVNKRARRMVGKWSGAIGGVQRFCIGFRGPLCLVCGFMEVSAAKFITGVGLAAPFTMALQFCMGYVLKDCANVYLAALAIVAGPNLIGHIAGPILTWIGVYLAGRGGGDSSSKGEPQPNPV